MPENQFACQESYSEAFNRKLRDSLKPLIALSKRMRASRLRRKGLSESYAPKPFVGSIDI